MMQEGGDARVVVQYRYRVQSKQYNKKKVHDDDDERGSGGMRKWNKSRKAEAGRTWDKVDHERAGASAGVGDEHCEISQFTP